jgi:hypothetical protein
VVGGPLPHQTRLLNRATGDAPRALDLAGHLENQRGHNGIDDLGGSQRPATRFASVPLYLAEVLLLDAEDSRRQVAHSKIRLGAVPSDGAKAAFLWGAAHGGNRLSHSQMWPFATDCFLIAWPS